MLVARKRQAVVAAAAAAAAITVDSSSQGVKTQRRNLQHGEDDIRLVFGVMIMSRKVREGADDSSTLGSLGGGG